MQSSDRKHFNTPEHPEMTVTDLEGYDLYKIREDMQQL
jgi:hypothetical protein